MLLPHGVVSQCLHCRDGHRSETVSQGIYFPHISSDSYYIITVWKQLISSLSTQYMLFIATYCYLTNYPKICGLKL